MHVPESAPYAAIPLRLVAALSFLVHGGGKFGAGHASFVEMLTGLGVPAPGLTAWVVAGVEVIGALMLLAGFLTRVAAIPLIVVMLVAMVTVHLPNGYSWMNVTGMTAEGPVFGLPGYELSLLFIAILVALVFTGSGPMSIDAMRRERAGHRG